MSTVHWLALIMLPGIGGVTARKLAERFGGVEDVWEASDEELLAVPRITPEVVRQLRALSLDDLERELESLSDSGLRIITWDDDDYPANLRHVGDAPALLFVRGDVLPEDDRAVAIVGTREPTPRAVRLAEKLAGELAGRDLTVVSGLALGIDTAAHRGALQAPDGRTLAVLGSGLNSIHPRENVQLAERIAGRGALLSELLPNTPPRGPSLMARDRIISGLSLAVVVVEAGEKSGSLDTAARAHRQGRLVLAVPGSPGTELLLSQGAERLDPGQVYVEELVQRIRAVSVKGEEEKGEPVQLGLW